MSTIVGQQAVLRLIQSKQATSQIELARTLDLPSNTLHGIVKRLVAEGVIAEFRQERSGRGRPSLHYSIRRPGKVLVMIWWGSEWQGTVVGEGVDENLESVAFRCSSVPHLAAARKSFLRLRDEVLNRSHLGIRDLDGAIVMLNCGRVIDGIPSSSSIIPFTSEISESTLGILLGCETLISEEPHMAELELRSWVRDGVRRLVRFNVADGASAHYASMVGAGVHVVPGQVGHVIRESEGEICGCGNRGCLETLISGPRLMRKVQRDISNGVNSLLAKALRKTPVEFFEELEWLERKSDDAYVKSVVATFLDHCAWGISIAINMFQPNVVVISGYALGNRASWKERIADILPSYVVGAGRPSLRLEDERQQMDDHLGELATEFFLRKNFKNIG